MLLFGMALQRDCGESTLSSITYFPGARFIIAGLLSRPGSYYKVSRQAYTTMSVFLLLQSISVLVPSPDVRFQVRGGPRFLRSLFPASCTAAGTCGVEAPAHG